MPVNKTLTRRLDILENMYLEKTPFALKDMSKGVSGLFLTAVLTLGLVSRDARGLYTFVGEVPDKEMAETVLAQERKMWRRYQSKNKPLVTTPIQRIEKKPAKVTTVSTNSPVSVQKNVEEYTIKVNTEKKEVTLPLKTFIKLLA